MARNVSDEELQLKKRARRRLVGAVVLVTAVAVVLPMILDSEPKPASQNINIQIPSPDAGVLTAKPVPLKPPETAASKPEAESMPEPKIEAKPPAKAETQATPKAEAKTKPVKEAAPKTAATKPAVKPAAKPETKSAEPPKPVAGSFVVQVMALSDAGRAKAMQAKIAGSGLKAYTEVVQTATGPVTRVRVGPYASRDAAEKARQQLLGMKFDSSKVVPVQ
ncbi:MAG: SPOR domain-containing protein [Burkholderiales bacterium]